MFLISFVAPLVKSKVFIKIIVNDLSNVVGNFLQLTLAYIQHLHPKDPKSKLAIFNTGLSNITYSSFKKQ